jgi:hypothetical protein
LLAAEPGADVVAGLEFVADRLPGRLGPDLLAAVDEALIAGTARPEDDIVRWSAVLRRTGGHTPQMTSRYLRAALTHVAGGTGGAELWLPEINPDQIDGDGWIAAVMGIDPRPEVVSALLATLRRLGVEPSDEELGEVVERVLLPVVLDPHGNLDPIRALPGAARLASVTIARLESRLDDDLIETAAESMSEAAAHWLAPSAAPGTRCAVVIAVALARAGARDPVAVAATAADGAQLDRLAALLWPEPPSAATGGRLLAVLERDVLTRSALPAWLAERLVVDAREKRSGRRHVELALQLGALGNALDERTRTRVEAVLLTEEFRNRPRSDPSTRERAVSAVASHADPTLAEPLARVVVHWVFACAESLTHADLLRAAFSTRSPGSAAFLSHYREQLTRTLGTADTAGVIAVLPALVHLSATWQEATELLGGTCASALSQRRRRALDELGQRLSETGSVPPDLRPGRAASWTAWWTQYRASQLAGAGLRDRVWRLGRKG